MGLDARKPVFGVCEQQSHRLFLFSNKMLVFVVGIYKMLVRIANREDADQTASDLNLRCLSRPFWQVICVKKN